MKILEIKELEIPEIKVIKFAKFLDQRGYFTEQFRKSDMPSFLKDVEFVQANQSSSKKNTIRGMHFQWNPFMGKMVRTLSGNMTDLILDIRKDSPTYGKMIAYNMPSNADKDYDEWIWVPPGFAHGNFFTEDTMIEYMCSGEYSPNCEAGISPLAKDIDWSLCNPELKNKFDEIASTTELITDKDRNAPTMTEWTNDERSNNFIYPTKILFTGGSGLLGTEMKKLMPESYFPTKDEFDVTNYEQIKEYIKGKQIGTIIHAAAFTSPPLIDQNPPRAIDSNIVGTSNIVKLCSDNNIKLIYISTDYVFDGEQGNYKEEDPVLPINKYAWSKLGGECAVRLYNKSLIVRSFGPNEFPFEKAFVDQWTSRESVSNFAKKLSEISKQDILGVLHLAGPRKTVFEYAKELDPSKEIGELKRDEVGFNVPKDTSLNCEKYKKIVGE